MPVRLVRRVNRLPWKAIIVAVLALAVVAWWADDQSQRRDEETTQSRIDGCERAKQRDIVLAFAAQTEADYKAGVIKAQSVQQDVKKLATPAQSEWAKVAEVARERLVLCEPLIRDGEEVPDRQALKEAKGG